MTSDSPVVLAIAIELTYLSSNPANLCKFCSTPQSQPKVGLDIYSPTCRPQ